MTFTISDISNAVRLTGVSSEAILSDLADVFGSATLAQNIFPLPTI